MPTIRLAAASPATQSTLQETLEYLSRIAHRAGSAYPRSADILVLPEAYLGGYPRGSTFGCAIGSRTAEGRSEYLAYFKNAIDLGDTVGEGGAGAGDAWVRREIGEKRGRGEGEREEQRRGDGTREELEKIASQSGVFLVVGCVEKAGGSLYCSAVYVCPTKGMIGKRRKVLPTGSERLVWAQGSPSTLRAVSTTIRGTRVNLAAAICWENYMPLVRQALYAQNINLYLAPTADERDTWLSLMRTIGIEGRCFVVSSNMAVRKHGTAPASSSGSAISNSTSTEFENGALPNTHVPHRANGPDKKLRRRSVPCGDGNEIIIPDLPRHSLPQPDPARPTFSQRRNSILCEDGNEIVLPPSITAWPPCSAGSPPITGVAATSKPAATKGAPPSSSWICRGGSCIVSPFGEVLAGPQWEDDEGIIYADVDFDDCIRGRLDLDTAGSYSRNDSFKFSVEGLDLEPLPY